MGNNRRAGVIYLRINGEMQEAKGSFSYNLGLPKRDAIIGADKIHGYKEAIQVPFIEGAVTDRPDLKLEDFASLDDGTVTLELVNGKTIVLTEAWFAGEGTVTTEEAEIGVRYESSRRGEEI